MLFITTVLNESLIMITMMLTLNFFEWKDKKNFVRI